MLRATLYHPISHHSKIFSTGTFFTNTKIITSSKEHGHNFISLSLSVGFLFILKYIWLPAVWRLPCAPGRGGAGAAVQLGADQQPHATQSGRAGGPPPAGGSPQPALVNWLSRVLTQHPVPSTPALFVTVPDFPRCQRHRPGRPNYVLAGAPSCSLK